MATTAEKFALTNRGFRARLVDLSDDQLNGQTPCEGWTAKDCIDHVLEIYLMVARAVDPSVTDLDDATPLERFDHLAPRLEAATEDAAVASVPVESPFGPLPLKQLISSVVLHDTLVHTWDVAVATGGDRVLEPSLVESAFAKMAPLDAMLRGEKTFGAKVEAPEGADLQTEFLCFLGRDVSVS